eukprot:CAMPEP_0197004928 /NCGR_PEP_ID=MMETSP1380-20130617/26603_1 /TAXON_ID=5936 /ORGANISM="Euplotes crassus, Strain CT5" /LENGTH=75 /DNA_ID=CAMNT_0042423889 /DNA_START=462 /DNA_END=689 /DNA_ORIENTATION=+
MSYPNERNIHSFTAVENASFIDILLPNYDMRERFCHYYHETDSTKKVGEKTEITYKQPDESFDMNLVDFKGTIIE